MKKIILLAVCLAVAISAEAYSQEEDTGSSGNWRQQHKEQMRQRRLEKMDANQDGQIDQAERQQFRRSRADLNNDGQVDDSEKKQFLDRREDVRDRREDRWDRREDVRDRREDVRDRRDDKIKANALNSLNEQLANSTDPDERAELQQRINRLENNIQRDKREDVLDRREDVRDRREDRWDRREDVRDRREDRWERRENRRERRKDFRAEKTGVLETGRAQDNRLKGAKEMGGRGRRGRK
jgi:hypothetical protein